MTISVEDPPPQCNPRCPRPRTVRTFASREPPDVGALVGLLNDHGVRYLVTGSVAAMLHGVALEPGDLDITPARDRDNLERLATVLRLIDARQDPNAGFGEWQARPNREQRWVQRQPTPDDIAARTEWKPDPDDPGSFDHLLASRYGSIDVVPEVSGTYEYLMPRAVAIEAHGQTVWVEGVDDLLAIFTVPRGDKDRDRVQQLRAIQRRRALQRISTREY
jgi:hypothetical protein